MPKACPNNMKHVCPCQSRDHEGAASSFVHLSAAVCKKMLAAGRSTHPFKPLSSTLAHRGSFERAPLPTRGLNTKITYNQMHLCDSDI